jgi:hypothetical protein
VLGSNVIGHVDGGLEAEADVEKVADDAVEQLLARHVATRGSATQASGGCHGTSGRRNLASA